MRVGAYYPKNGKQDEKAPDLPTDIILGCKCLP